MHAQLSSWDTRLVRAFIFFLILVCESYYSLRLVSTFAARLLDKNQHLIGLFIYTTCHQRHQLFKTDFLVPVLLNVELSFHQIIQYQQCH